MTFTDLETMVNRALFLCWNKTKILLTAIFLAFCGLCFAFCQMLAQGVEGWMGLHLALLPWFFTYGLLFALGVILMRFYYHEVKGKAFTYKGLLQESTPQILASMNVSLPFVGLFLCLWFAQTLFSLFAELPVLNVLLSFAPFLLLCAVFSIVALSIFALFLFAPFVAFQEARGKDLLLQGWLKLRESIFMNVIFALLAALPFILVGGLLFTAIQLTLSHYLVQGQGGLALLQRTILMLPVAALLAPAVIFFFNLSVEIHKYLRKEIHKQAASS